MIVKILLLATVAVANARHVNVDFERGAVKSDRCPAVGHYLLPHEWDCTKFYYCEYGKKWETARDCSPGTEFSYDLQVCVHPASANCQLSRVPPSSEESDESSEVTTDPATEVPSTEASVISTRPPSPTTTTTEATTEAETEAPTTEAVTEPETEVPSTEASVISSIPPSPTTTTTEATTEAETEAPTTEAVTEPETEVPSTEASIISTIPPSPTTTTTEATTEAETEAPTTEAVTEPETEVPSTEASVISTIPPSPTTTTTEATTEAETEAPTTEAVTEPETEVPSTEASVISTLPPSPTTTTTEATTEAETEAPTTEAAEPELLPNGCPADFDVHLLLPHETSCDKFYYCVFGEKVVRNCAPNTYFNVALQTCDWPENVECTNAETSESSEGSSEVSEESEGSGDPGTDTELLPNGCPVDFDVHKLLPHESDCGKFYYCVFGETVERECAPGTLFNAEIQVCDLSENVECDLNNTSENNESSNGNNENSNENNENSEENDILDNGCPADFDVHKLLPHESDCSKFYYCVFGNKVERDCSPGNHFNPILEVCDRPEDAGCVNASSEESETSQENASSEETTTSVPETTTTPVTTTTEAAEIELLPNGCPADFDVHKLLPHESDCGKFYYCVFGEKVERSCAAGTHFNPTEQVCDWPANVNCTNSNDSNENDNETSNEDNDIGIEGSGNSNEDDDIGVEDPGTSIEDPGTSVEDNGNGDENEILENGCPADFDVHKLLPHEYECGKFYYCVFGEKVERDCAPGTHFNPKEQVCDRPENVLCVGSAGSSIESSQESSEEVVEPILPNGCPSDFDVHQLLPHEECGKFYYCVFGEKVERECAPGTHFNPELQVCDHPENAGCANTGSEEDQTTENPEDGSSLETSDENGNSEETDSGNTSEETTTSVPETTTNVPETTTSVPETTTTPVTTTTEAAEIELLPNGCPADFDVHKLLPHESDCGKFYYCVFGEKVERSCAPGTHFSPAEQTCDWPENVQCENSNNSNEDDANSNEDDANSNEDNANSNEDDANSNEDSVTSNEDNVNSNENNGTSAENGTLDNGCPSDFDVHKLLPHESDCGKFYYCVFGEKVERSCAPGTHFSPAEQTCDWPENVQCENSNNSNEDDANSNEDDANSNEDDANSNEDDANSNEDNVNSNENNGTSAENGTLDNGCPSDFDVHKLLPHESECAKFYYCVFGEKVERSCAPGTHFNPTEQVCDHPENAGCVNADSEEDQISESAETESQENSNEDKCKTSCNIPAWAHEHDCDKFWRCDGENAVLGTCSEGLHFNVNTQTCDFICNAGCVRDDVQSTAEHDGLKLFLPWGKVDKTMRKLYLGQK